jgi:hypothetical protein
MMLFANTCLTGLACTFTLFALTVFTLYNDLKQIQYQDSLCVARGYLIYASPALHAYSYVSSAIYQYMIIVYPTRLFWQSGRTQLSLIILGWILAFSFPIPFLFTGEITYNVDNQICEVPFRLSLSVFYIPLFVFTIPMSLIIFIYFKLIRHVREMGTQVTVTITLFRAQRDLAMVRRIIILLLIILTAGVPMTLFFVLSFFNLAPKYHSRIGYFFVDISLLCVMIVLFKFTDLLEDSVKKVIFSRKNTALPTVTVKRAVVRRQVSKC